ncbi:uncharacterized protein LOC112043381 isoform X1 [Bicyclus anynana]|uniref:Uncharacterized protein LOC112043381 isoform X1 n=1 Tax=Bicyclus anynana TaxID=110368 RepID=A0A6J1MH54_BICAN|nr:uncharacterized protein LOC112043381 isoform X1 [Bicyclus anynana]XP_023934541.1 uncharacterized protein LOC112043381 isoform X1 [Bicyclus anynana]
MPGKIKVKVLAGRNLPVMDRASDTTDAFVEIKFGGVTHKTDVCRKSLNPQWNSTEWYRFEVDESELQDEPLQLRLMDHDTYSANDAIGKVVISLAPLLAREANNTAGPPGGAVMSGWIPVFDTMHGIRGELNVIVKVELFSDFNKYKTSSCGVQFFHCPMIPPGYRATAIHGFVEELIVNDDPEYQWIDKIRTPRASNEARQVAFINLSNQVQRLVGLKAAELGANAVVGYQQDFDLEGEAGVVARAIGTAVSITPLPTPSVPLNITCTQQQLKKCLDILATDEESVTDLHEYYLSHPEELMKIVGILNPQAPLLLDDPDTFDEDEKSLEGQTKPTTPSKSYTGDLSIYQDNYVATRSLRHLSEDQIDLDKLLNRPEPPESINPLKTIRKIKENLFSKKFNKRSSKSDIQDDQISIKSTSSDTSRISISDIKKEIKKMKKLKMPKIITEITEDDGVGMASILARSVIHAHTSLACITESQDSENSPGSTLRRTSESEPNVTISDDDRTRPQSGAGNVPEHDRKSIPEIHCGSLENIMSNETVPRERKISESCPTSPMVSRNENFLKLPGDEDFYGSVSSALSHDSSEVYSSSDEDDESYDMKSDQEQMDTTSSVIQSVLGNANFMEMERKRASMEMPIHEDTNYEKSINQYLKDSENDNDKTFISGKDHRNVEKQDVNAQSLLTGTASTCVPIKSNNSHSIKLHNPFAHKKASKSISAPSSPVEKKSFIYRSSKKIKRHLSKISKNSMIKSLSHYSLLPKKKHIDPKAAMSQPGSASDVTSKAPSDTVLGSPFLSYTDLLSLDRKGFTSMNHLHKSDEHVMSKAFMYIGSEPVSRSSLSGPSFSRDDHFHEQKSFKREHPKLKPDGLVHTAMETILMDKVESLLVPTSPDSIIIRDKDRKFFDDVNEKLEKVQGTEIESKGLVHSALETVLIDTVESLLLPTTPDPVKSAEKGFFDNVSEQLDKDKISKPKCNSKAAQTKYKLEREVKESKGLIHSAMETMLIDKVQSILMPTTPDAAISKDKEFFKDAKNTKSETEDFALVENSEAVVNKTEAKKSDEIKDIKTQNTELPKDVKLQTEHKSKGSDKSHKVNEKKEKKLVRQDSIHTDDTVSPNMSKELDPNAIAPCKLTHAPMLQHFHPILSGSPLETIPSLPESVDRTQSIDVDGVDTNSVVRSEGVDVDVDGVDTNSVSVCNSHAACGVDRSERERDRERDRCDKDKGSPRHARHESYGGKEPVGSVTVQNASLNSSSTPLGIHRRSSDSDLSVTPKGSSLNASGGVIGSGGGAILRPSMNSNNLEMLEYPFLTMTEYPPGFIVHIGGTVCARSVKLVDAGGESAARAAWWAELRTELRAHARALRCTAVLAYSERAAVREDVCVLSASGTAAVINLDCDFTLDEPAALRTDSKNALDECEAEPCSVAHVPYSPGAGPYRAELATCGGCRRARVPSVLLATCAKPNRLTSYAKAVTLTAVAARCRRAVGAEAGARDLSDQLPFLEYELHKLLLAKLRMQGANAIFSLETQIAIGERCVMALASGTAVRLGALPPPAPPRIKASENDKNAIEIQKALWDTFTANKAANGYDMGSQEHSTNGALPEAEGDEAPALDLCADKDACVLELDEAEDVETAKALAVRRNHMQVFTSALRPARAAPPHAFMQVWRARLGSQGSGAERLVASALTGAAYKLRRLQPAALAAPSFHLELPEDEIQLVVSGTAIPLHDPSKVEHVNGAEKEATVDGDDDIFALDEEQLVKAPPEVVEEKNSGPAASRVSLTTLSTVEGTKVARRVCSLRLLFVRETTAVRELGGLSGFLHTFTCEVLAIVRAYTAALGGNALTSLYLVHLLLHHNGHKNQGQCLLSVGGDVVHITY